MIIRITYPTLLHGSDFLWFLFELLMTEKYTYRIYANKHRGASLIFCATSAALIQGRRLFKHCTRQIYFFYIFIQRYTYYLLIFLWTDTKLIVNLELREKFTRRKNPESFTIMRAKISAMRALGVQRFLTFLSQMQHLIEGGAYSSKYGTF